MEFDNLLMLMKTMSDSSLMEFLYEENGIRIILSKSEGMHPYRYSESSNAAELYRNEGFTGTTETTEIIPEAIADSVDTPKPGSIVTSPLVGIFYAAAAEGAKPMAAVGDKVEKGQTLAIVEAMKLMNEIECEYEGTIAEIYVENQQPVEYGQPLFRII